jgi:hypothetical protein
VLTYKEQTHEKIHKLIFMVEVHNWSSFLKNLKDNVQKIVIIMIISFKHIPIQDIMRVKRGWIKKVKHLQKHWFYLHITLTLLLCSFPNIAFN